MALRIEFKKAVRAVAAPMAAASLVVYFGLDAVQGERGVLRWIELRQDIVRAEHDLAAVSARRALFERRVASLRSDRLDADYLDERARLMTGFLGPRDLILTGVPEAADEPGLRRAVLGVPARGAGAQGGGTAVSR